MDVAGYNRRAWDGLVEQGNRWTVPVLPETVRAARLGEWQIVLTPTRPVPRHWFPPLEELPTLCLASGGGQQGPILAAAGARVTVYDNSPRQLDQDRRVSERDDLGIETVLGDMRDLGAFPDETFGLIVHPCANAFVPDIPPVWREAHRVLRQGGLLLAGFLNPVHYIFDEARAEAGELVVRHKLPYSDSTSLEAAELAAFEARGEPLVFSHSLEDLIGGQTRTGFVITDLYEDSSSEYAISAYLPTFLATRARKSGQP